MSDVVWSVKLNEETKDKIIEMTETLGVTSKDFVSVLLQAYELEQHKMVSQAHNADLEEISRLTTRLYEVVVNITRKSEVAISELQARLDGQSQRYADQEAQLQEETERANGVSDALRNELIAANTTIQKLQNEVKSLDAAKQELQNQTKSLTQLVAQYQGYEKENRELEKKLDDLARTNQDLSEKLALAETGFNDVLAKLENEHQERLKSLADQKNFEKEREVITLRAEYQAKLEAKNEEYAATLKDLYGLLDLARQEKG